MPTPEQTVRAFINSWGENFEGMIAGLRRYMAPNCIWEQSGFPTTRSVDEAVNLLSGACKAYQIATIDVEMVHIATVGVAQCSPSEWTR